MYKFTDSHARALSNVPLESSSRNAKCKSLALSRIYILTRSVGILRTMPAALSLVGVGGGRSSSLFSQTSSKERERGRCFVGTISRETLRDLWRKKSGICGDCVPHDKAQ